MMTVRYVQGVDKEFWDNAPFCTLLFVDQKYQRKGYWKQIKEMFFVKAV